MNEVVRGRGEALAHPTETKELFKDLDDAFAGHISWYNARACRHGFFARWLSGITYGVLIVSALWIAIHSFGLRPSFPDEEMTASKVNELVFYSNLGNVGFIIAAFAVLLIGFDKLYGLSSSWARYRTMQLELQRLQKQFRIDWLKEWVNGPADDFASPNALKFINIVDSYTQKMFAVMEEEHRTWVADMLGGLTFLMSKITEASASKGERETEDSKGNAEGKGGTDQPEGPANEEGSKPTAGAAESIGATPAPARNGHDAGEVAPVPVPVPSPDAAAAAETDAAADDAPTTGRRTTSRRASRR